LYLGKIIIITPTLGLTQPLIHWVPGDVYLGIKWPVREAGHSPPSSSTLQYVFMA